MRWVRVLGITVASLVVLLAIAAGLVFAVSEFQIGRKYDVKVAMPATRTDPAAVEQGRHAATIRGCRDCHKPDLAGEVHRSADTRDLPVQRRRCGTSSGSAHRS